MGKEQHLVQHSVRSGRPSREALHRDELTPAGAWLWPGMYQLGRLGPVSMAKSAEQATGARECVLAAESLGAAVHVRVQQLPLCSNPALKISTRVLHLQPWPLQWMICLGHLRCSSASALLTGDSTWQTSRL